jgi:hypothetical protein
LINTGFANYTILANIIDALTAVNYFLAPIAIFTFIFNVKKIVQSNNKN